MCMCCLHSGSDGHILGVILKFLQFIGLLVLPLFRYGLDLNFKCVSKKIKVAKLGITLESQFIKEGGAK